MSDLDVEAGEREIEADRRRERRVLWQALLALVVVLVFVLVRIALVGGPGDDGVRGATGQAEAFVVVTG